MASLTYVCFVPAKGLIRDETYVCKASHNYLLSNTLTVKVIKVNCYRNSLVVLTENPWISIDFITKIFWISAIEHNTIQYNTLFIYPR